MMLLVRVGAASQVGRFRTLDMQGHARGSRVIVRTSRGLEVGQVLGSAGLQDGDPSNVAASDGSVIRRMTVEDELLASRLERIRHEALAACDEHIRQQKLDVTLLDAELLFDGGALYFYFLGEPNEALQEIVAELATAYDAEAQLRQFAEAVDAGCGPDCGTEDASGCGDGGCSTCAVVAACKKEPSS